MSAEAMVAICLFVFLFGLLIGALVMYVQIERAERLLKDAGLPPDAWRERP